MYRVTVNSAEGSSLTAQAGTYQFAIDPKGVSGITPPDTLLASLAGCVGVYLRKYAEGSKLSLRDFKIDAEAELTKEPPYCFKDIRITIDLQGFTLDDRRKAAVLEFIKNCPVHNTLKKKPNVTVTVR